MSAGPLPRIGIIGLGAFGLEHLQGAAECAAVDVVAVADPRRDHVDALAEANGIAHAFTDGVEMLDAIALDAVAVVSPSSTHLALADAAVARGVAVLLEKPVVDGLAETQRLIELDTLGLVIPAHILRSSGPYRSTRAALAVDGARVGAMTARRHRGIDHLERFPTADPVLMTMVHDIDLAIWFTGSRAVSVRAWSHGIRDPHRIDTVLAIVTDDAGRTWDLGSSWVLEENGPGDRFELYTDRGMRVIEGSRFDAAHAMRAQYEHLAAALAGTPPIVSVADAVHGIEIADAIIRSAAAGGAEVAIPPAQSSDR